MARHRFGKLDHKSVILNLEKTRCMRPGEHAGANEQAAFRGGCRFRATAASNRANCAPPGFNADL
jgi:hypothetical protein